MRRRVEPFLFYISVLSAYSCQSPTTVEPIPLSHTVAENKTSSSPHQSGKGEGGVEAEKVKQPQAVSARMLPVGKNAYGYTEYLHEPSGITFVLLPGGAFWMGGTEEEHQKALASVVENAKSEVKEKLADELPRHQVTLDPFFIAKYEVTEAQWKKITGYIRHIYPPPGDKTPVGDLSWNECKGFCVNTGLKLPSEAQWEYACRAGSTTPFSFGASISAETQVNYDGVVSFGTPPEEQTRFREALLNGNIPGLPTPRFSQAGLLPLVSRMDAVSIGSLPPNAFGLHEMHGNRAEWCEDVYDKEFYSKPQAMKANPISTSGSDTRVIRGGSYGTGANSCRSASRHSMSPAVSYGGFRPVYWPVPMEYITNVGREAR